MNAKEAGSPRPALIAVLAYGMLLFLIFSFGTMFELVVTRGVCFVYVISYFMPLVVVVAIRRVGWRWTGVAVFMPYTILGLPAEYYIEVIAEPNLIAPWAAVLWSLTGPMAGLVADLVYRYLPKGMREDMRSAVTGISIAVAFFMFVLLTLAFLYIDPRPGLEHYLNGIYLTFPWLVVNGALGGYTAHAMTVR